MKNYDTMVEALNDLKKRGYSTDFELKENCLACTVDKKYFETHDFKVVEVHRFEGMTNPGDSSVLYVIESSDGRKGTLLDAYGADSENISPELARKLHWNPSEA